MHGNYLLLLAGHENCIRFRFWYLFMALTHWLLGYGPGAAAVALWYMEFNDIRHTKPRLHSHALCSSVHMNFKRMMISHYFVVIVATVVYYRNKNYLVSKSLFLLCGTRLDTDLLRDAPGTCICKRFNLLLLRLFAKRCIADILKQLSLPEQWLATKSPCLN